ncbi:hypothetical protein SFUMM280S_11404 [Streptomyces fumanus]
MGAPTELDESRLRELHLSVRKPQPAWLGVRTVEGIRRVAYLG